MDTEETNNEGCPDYCPHPAGSEIDIHGNLADLKARADQYAESVYAGATAEEIQDYAERPEYDRPELDSEEGFVVVSGPVSAEEINSELDQLTARVYAEPEAGAIKLWSFAFNAEETLALYAALRTYMRALTNQDDEDLEMMARIVKMLQRVKPGAVKASKHTSLKAVGKEQGGR